MNRLKRTGIGILLLLITLMLVVPQAAVAATVIPNTVSTTPDTATTPEELQSKLNTALLARTEIYNFYYTGSYGSEAAFKQMLTTVMDKIEQADDYLHYSIKSCRYSFSYTPAAQMTRITFTYTYWNNKAQADYVEARVTEVLNQIISAGANDFQKEKAIHDWIVANVAYDTTLKQHSDYAGLIKPYKTVCQGYALLGYKMLNQAGIKTRILEGKAGGQDHAWNAVYLDGAWYHLDLTWDDPIPDVAGRLTYAYYNLTDAQIRTNHKWTLSYPTAATAFEDTLAKKSTTDPANAVFYQGLSTDLGLHYLTPEYTVTSSADLSARLQKAIQMKQTGFKVRYLNGKKAAADLKAAITVANSPMPYSYAITDYVRSSAADDVLLDIKLTAIVPVSVQSVSVKPSFLKMTVGGTTGKLNATVSPANASQKAILWSTSDPTVATVSAAGVVTPVSAGTATITATSVDGNKQATVNVIVSLSIKSVTLNQTTATVSVGGSDLTLSATVNPDRADTQGVTWTSSNPAVATVSATGVVKALTGGKAVITATSKIDSKKSAKCTVTVPIAVSGIKIPTTLTALIGTKVNLKASLTPTNATLKTVVWRSSDPTVATVNSSGAVTPLKAGSAEITATTADGGKTATCKLTVVQDVTKKETPKRIE